MANLGTLIIKPIAGKLTRDTEVFGKMDPYVVIKVGQHKLRSKVHKDGGKFPAWQDAIPVQIGSEDILSIEVWDQDSASTDDLVGSTSIPIQQLKQAGRVVEWYNLSYKGRSSGQIRIEFQWFPPQVSQQNQQESQQAQQPQQPQTILIQQPPQPYPGYPPQTMQYPPQTMQYPPQTGYPPQTMQYPPQTGYPPQTYPPQTYPPQTYPPQTYPPQTYPPQTYLPQNYPPQGYPQQPMPPQGYPQYQPNPAQQFMTPYVQTAIQQPGQNPPGYYPPGQPGYYPPRY